MKAKSVFICQQCGGESGKWLGRCPSCGAWNSLEEERTIAKKSTPTIPFNPLKLEQIEFAQTKRTLTGVTELDRVLGGGMVQGSLILVGGEPGIGKSTLLLQICKVLCGKGSVLYVSGEESEAQIKLRAQRLEINPTNLLIAGGTNIESICASIEEIKPCAAIIDSIQTMYCDDLQSAPGSVTQVRESTMRLLRTAKSKNITLFLVGHVTKDGAIAGPRVLEHMVDCVLYFEGERHQNLRTLRAVKNRFGSTNEIGVFEMTGTGLADVSNPSAMLLEGRPKNVSGSAICCAVEGTRPLLAEVQALVTLTSYGTPRRMSIGLDYNRMVLLMAVMEKWLKVNLGTYDAYTNIVGGIRLDETAIDLAVAAAIMSSVRNTPLPDDTVYIGEVGLTGELRAISHAEKRVSEISRLGFKTCILPAANQIKDSPMEIIYAKTLAAALI